MSPRRDQDQVLSRLASHMAGHVAVHYFQRGRAQDMSINRNGRLTSAMCNSCFDRGILREIWRFENRDNDLPAIISGPLAESWYNEYNEMEFEQALKEYQSDPESPETRIPELLNGDPLKDWVRKTKSKFRLRYEKIKKLTETLIDRKSLSASEVEQILKYR